MANAPDVQDLNPQFLGNINGLLEAVKKAGGNPSISSGFRTKEQQANIPKNNPYPVAKPGTSLHEKGIAADIVGDDNTMRLLHQMAPQFGLAFPFANDPIHVQPADVSKATPSTAAGPLASGASPQPDGPMPLKDRLNALAAMFDGNGQAPSTGTPTTTSSIGTPPTGTPEPASGVASASSAPATGTGAVGSNGLSELTSAADSDAGTTEGQPGVAAATTAPTGDNSANQSLGQNLAKQFGWDQGNAWSALNNIIMHESKWDPSAANPTSSARGIGQNIHGWSQDYQQGNAQQQILWTYNYIKNRYGSPEAAWQHWQQNNWY
jgi:hypothetical protein